MVIGFCSKYFAVRRDWIATDVCKTMAATTVYISIAIYVGDPIDHQKYRHTNLYLEFANREPSALVHVVGPPGEFEFTV